MIRQEYKSIILYPLFSKGTFEYIWWFYLLYLDKICYKYFLERF